jgi:dihydrolipoamide dehydrogenase
MDNRSCDVAIIGAGTAGLAAERSARRVGASTLLIDDRFAGTTCTTVGCMPSKLLIAAAEAAHAVRRAPLFGVKASPPDIDGAAVMTRVRVQRDAFVRATIKSIEDVPAEIRIKARARFVGRDRLALDDGSTVSARTIVIATGSRPRVPPMFAALGDRILTNETIFDLPDLPRSVAVIGAGPLGLELAQALARLGVETRVFDEGLHLAGLHDEKVATVLKAILAEELPVHLGVTLSVARAGDAVTISWKGASTGEARFERVLVATGRPPDLGDLDLKTTGIALDDHGTPKVDPETMQCGDAPIFVCGDADAQRPVLHEAAIEGAIAGRNAATYPTVNRAKRNVAFSIMFTDPPLAVIGPPAGEDLLVGQASYADQGRAKVEGRNAGLVILHAARPDGRLIGAVLLGPGMDHVGHLLAWAIERGETATALLRHPFYHPTLEEGLKTALRQICAAAEIAAAPEQDDGFMPGA